MSFRENLKDELTFQDMTVKELANKTGISKHTIDHYLTTNGSQPQVELAVRIAKALNVTVEYLVLGKATSELSDQSKNRISTIKKIERLPENDFNFIERIVNNLEK
ncbi:helix-turn-helix domain-containing protein [Treponema bryantii]|uniref:helix-turn-helix domain-containing protein n=1 Tax=Treponema bryantii TaxID=163 RepID=UPI0018C91002|nr:helix-turn-helix transcriptional regulator [Treponema bryantii]